MQRALLVLAIIAAIVVVGVPLASAGGWATVQLSSTPTGLRAGQTWDVRLTILQHGRTPLSGLRPAILLRKGKVRRVVVARATATEGVYRARVVFPAAGRWTWQVDDGFTRLHSYAPVRIAAAR